MTEEELKLLVSEYRFTYWRGDHGARFFRVCRGLDALADRWGVFDGMPHTGAAWSGTHWSYETRGADAFCWDEEEACTIAALLARQENARIVEVMERRFPGEFKGGQHAMAAKEEK